MNLFGFLLLWIQWVLQGCKKNKHGLRYMVSETAYHKTVLRARQDGLQVGERIIPAVSLKHDSPCIFILPTNYCAQRADDLEVVE